MSALPHTQDKPTAPVSESVHNRAGVCDVVGFCLFLNHSLLFAVCSSPEEEDEKEGWMESGRRTNPHHEGVSGDHSRKR